MKLFNEYSDYLKSKYGEKVYKLPVNIPCTCPNRDGTLGFGGCTFCSDVGAGFELLDNSLSVKEHFLFCFLHFLPRKPMDLIVRFA
jgi:radical SAM superfamily enzyme